MAAPCRFPPPWSKAKSPESVCQDRNADAECDSKHRNRNNTKHQCKGFGCDQSVKGLRRGSSGFAAMGRSPIRSPRFLNVDVIQLFLRLVSLLLAWAPLPAALVDQDHKPAKPPGRRRPCLGCRSYWVFRVGAPTGESIARAWAPISRGFLTLATSPGGPRWARRMSCASNQN